MRGMHYNIVYIIQYTVYSILGVSYLCAIQFMVKAGKTAHC